MPRETPLTVIAAAAAAADARPALAVLPFANRSTADGDAYFTDGIHDEVITRLSKIAGIRVISRASVQGYAATVDRRQVPSELDAGYLLEGSIQRSGERVRVNVRLTGAASGEALWSELYDEQLSAADLFTVQSDIAHRIAAALHVQLTMSETRQIEARPTTDLLAYELYMRANLYSAREVLSGAADSAVALYARAVERDPQFALPHAGLARARAPLAGNSFRGPEAELARQSLARALELAPGAAETHIAAGYCHYYVTRDYTEALARFEAAAELRPNDPQRMTVMAFILRRQGRWEDAERLLSDAAVLDPRSHLTHYSLAQTLRDMRRYDAAPAALDRAAAIAPDIPHTYSQRVLLRLLSAGDTVAARHEAESAASIFGPAINASLAATVAYYRGDVVAAYTLLAAHTTTPAERWNGIMNAGDPRALAIVAHVLGRVGDTARHAEALRTWAFALQQRAERGDMPVAGLQRAIAHGNLAIALALLGERAGAVSEARLAVELLPLSQDAFTGAQRLWEAVLVHAILGDAAGVAAALRPLLAAPSTYSIHTVPLDPLLRPFLGHPAFRALKLETET